MKRRWHHIFLCLAAMLGLQVFQSGVSFSQPITGKLNMAMMDKDLNIMESILDKLLAKNDYQRIHLAHNSTRGVFIPSYGIIFTVPVQTSVFQILMSEIYALDEGPVSLINTDRQRNSAAPMPRKDAEAKISYFFGKYADAIRQLRASDKITVIYTNQFSAGNDAYWSSQVQRDPGFTVTASFKNIQQFNSGEINRQKFDERLSVRPAIRLRDKQPEMAIFINAMHTILRSNEAESFALRGVLSQIHLDEFGMIVSFEANFLSSNSFEYFFRVNPNASEFTGTGMARGKKRVSGVNIWSQFSHIDTVSTDQLQRAFAAFEEKLLHIITRYAPTLDLSQPELWLVLAAKINPLNSKIPTRAVYKVQNKAIRAFMDRKTSRDDFLKRIETYKYYPHQ